MQQQRSGAWGWVAFAALAAWVLARRVEVVEVIEEDLPDVDDEADDEAVDIVAKQPIHYLCVRCESEIDPDHCWAMESEQGGWVYVTYHCPCQPADAHLLVRYHFNREACLHLSRGRGIRALVSGGWRWDAPVRLRYATPDDPQVVEFRETLNHVQTPEDIIRLAGDD